MPDLLHTLQGHDLGFLKMVAGLWGMDLNAPDVRTALPALTGTLLNPSLVPEVVEALPNPAQQALQAILANEGRMSWPQFCRKFGEVRTMGTARRDRERPDLKPVSPAEMLWYRALIGRAFLNVTPEPQEFAYIPDDLVELLPSLAASIEQPLGRPASRLECAHPIPANDHILDQACTLLAALRMGSEIDNLPIEENIPRPILQRLLYAANLLDANQLPQPEPVRKFLEAPRGQALATLAEAWMQSTNFNELRLLPGLVCEGEWINTPLQTRHFLLNLLSHLPQDNWWSLSAFTSAVREQNPDFQRPAGDYDSWFIRKADSDQYLRGFASWDEVEGALIRFLITGPMHWLGIYELAAPEPGALPTAFRPTAWAASLWHGQPPAGLRVEEASLKVLADGRLVLPELTPRPVRYQIARFGRWLPPVHGEYTYLLTPESLERARQQGLKPAHLLSLLRKHAVGPLPPTLLQALDRWEQSGVQARIERVTLLRTTSPEVMAAIRRSRAARFLAEALNDTTVIVRPGAEEALLRALAETGYLAAAQITGEK